MSTSPIVGFPPVSAPDARVLILGSMPGMESLRRHQYYGNPRNQFWPLVAEIFDFPLPPEYQDRCRWVQSCQLALWDVIFSCRREGSADEAIIDVEVNDIPAFLREHPHISLVACNGATAFRLYREHFSHLSVTSLRLPSTSPAFARPLEWKLQAWLMIKRHVVSQSP